MATLELRHDRGVTPIVVARSLLGSAGPLAEEYSRLWAGRRVFLVSTPTISALHGEAARATFAGAAAACHALEVPDGESAKSAEVALNVWRQLLAAGGKRDSVIVALGGGATTDLAGFVAATFLRGVSFIQIPSTLLAQVDAAIGGKTGIDLEDGKNTVGAFHQPILVASDVDLLTTLPEREFRAGMAEVIKKAAILDPALFEHLESVLESVLAHGAGAPELARIVERAAAAKVQVVESDPFEGGRRKLLNFGHTLAHAIETELGYRSLRHGEAVAHGLRFATRLGVRLGLGAALAPRLEALIDQLGPPALPELSAEGLLGAMARDKKAREGGLTWVLAEGLGQGVLRAVDEAIVAEELAAFLAET